MNNEPVALVSVGYSNEPYVFSQLKTLPNGTHELYTTQQIKELSDEEIYEVLYSVDWAYDPVKFARAILKKASEK